jgi:hypothetical protein
MQESDGVARYRPEALALLAQPDEVAFVLDLAFPHELRVVRICDQIIGHRWSDTLLIEEFLIT